tara:strand:- start:109 stop:471 length:363 start_codon:yes stop_codon:yes gene_type:complete
MKLISLLIKFPVLKRFLPSLLRNIFIFFGKEQFKINFKKLILEINIRDPYDREIYFTQKYDENQFNELINIIEKNHIEIFLDVGANSGVYSLLFKLIQYRNMGICESILNRSYLVSILCR